MKEPTSTSDPAPAGKGTDAPAEGKAAPTEERQRWTAGRVVEGTGSFARDALKTTGNIAGDGVHLVRDLASDTVNAVGGLATDTVHTVGDVGNEVVKTASHLLSGLVEGIRGVADSIGRRGPPPS